MSRTTMKSSLVLAAVASLTLAACSSDASDDDTADSGSTETAETVEFDAGTTMAELNEAGAVTIGTKFDQPGFGLVNPTTNEPEGFDVEIAKIIAGELGISEDDITWTEAVTANREPFIEQDKVDFVVATYTINDERKQVIDFAGPYYTAGQDIMVAAGNPEGITGPDDLAGKTACSVEGSTPAENMRTNYPDTELILFDVYSKCAEAVKNGDAVAVTTDNVILLGLVAAEPEAFEMVNNPFTEEPYGIGVAKGDDDFRAFINDVVDEIIADGRWQEAWDATAGQFAEGSPDNVTVDRY